MHHHTTAMPLEWVLPSPASLYHKILISELPGCIHPWYLGRLPVPWLKKRSEKEEDWKFLHLWQDVALAPSKNHQIEISQR